MGAAQADVANGIIITKRIGLIPRCGGLYIWNIGDEADAARFWLSPDGQTVALFQWHLNKQMRVDEGHIPGTTPGQEERWNIHNQHDSINTCPTRGTTIYICRDC